jgi:glucose-6-phosphate isomerase
LVDFSLNYDYSFLIKKSDEKFLSKEKISNSKERAINALEILDNKNGFGNDFLGWLDLPEKMLRSEELAKIDNIAKQFKEEDAFIIFVGIGGSYLGARAVIECLSPSFYNEQIKIDYPGCKTYFAGNNLSGLYLQSLINILDESNNPLYINVISKSGTTTEPSITFRVLYQYLINRYGRDIANKRIIVTTDAKKGSLLSLAEKFNWEKRFIIPNDVGGRFSVFSPVGLFPIATAGINIKELLTGAKIMIDQLRKKSLDSNPALCYALTRNLLYEQGKTIEIFVTYEPAYFYLAEWWKQLFGESEGKDGKGIYPASITCSTDLHSLGQMIQDGVRNIFETILYVKKQPDDLIVPENPAFQEDNLKYLENRFISDINKTVLEGTVLAHYEGGIPCSLVELDKLDTKSVGSLLYFFEKSAGISGYLLGVNPFDQPAVQHYKDNLNTLLGNPDQKYQENRKAVLRQWKQTYGTYKST